MELRQLLSEHIFQQPGDLALVACSKEPLELQAPWRYEMIFKKILQFPFTDSAWLLRSLLLVAGATAAIYLLTCPAFLSMCPLLVLPCDTSHGNNLHTALLFSGAATDVTEKNRSCGFMSYIIYVNNTHIIDIFKKISAKKLHIENIIDAQE